MFDSLLDSYAHSPVRVRAQLVSRLISPARRRLSLFRNRRRAQCQGDGHFDRKR
jgi:hypothetical protein